MIDDGNPPEFWSERQIKCARTKHKCDECGRMIACGETYWYGFGKADNVVYSGVTCQHCRIIANWLLHNCNGFVYAAMVEDFGNHAEGSIPMLRIVVGARRKWRRFADPTQLMPPPNYPPDMA